MTRAEWLEADGLGGFASGTTDGIRRRRYHGLLTTAVTPPTGRQMLVSGFDAWVESTTPSGPVGTGPVFLTAQRYRPDVEGTSHVSAFTAYPWPTTTFTIADGIEVEQEIFVPRGRSLVVVRWRLVRPVPRLRLLVRPFLVARDIHALRRETAGFRLDAIETMEEIRWQPDPALPAVVSRHNGSYRHLPEWYRQFQLDEERARGFDFLEDAGSPGVLAWDLSGGDAVWLLAADGTPGLEILREGTPVQVADRLRRGERLRRSPRAGELPLRRAADSYLVKRGDGLTVVAGYPWFTDWGRDTFIALRGLCLATGRLDLAREILLQWAGSVSEGMLPNRFVDQGDQPEYNAVDASLWFVIVADELIALADRSTKRIVARDRRRLVDASQAILEGYRKGTRFGIQADHDGLLRAGVPGVQLTWMDAKVGDWVVTPRIGKPVEVQALWINALQAGAATERSWRTLAARATEAFDRRFWNSERHCLHDVVDPDGVSGTADPTLRPNQIFAVGGLPRALISGERARAVVETVERELWTPAGLRTLAPGEPGFRARYEGGPVERDGAYHQGTAWPWLMGPFVEAWLRVNGSTEASRATARARFFEPLLERAGGLGLGHLAEIADATEPFEPRGCPFQAWSVGEGIRIGALLGPANAAPAPRRRRLAGA